MVTCLRDATGLFIYIYIFFTYTYCHPSSPKHGTVLSLMTVPTRQIRDTEAYYSSQLRLIRIVFSDSLHITSKLGI